MVTIHDALAIGWKLFQARELARAEQVYRKVLAFDSTVVRAWFMLAAVQQVQGQIEAAVTSYQQVLRLEPDHVEALNNLGVAVHSQGKVEDALLCLRRALALKPDYADAHSNLGNALQEQGNVELAVASYERALELDPGHFDAHNNLGNALRVQGRLAESVASYERALAIRPDDPQVRMSRSLCWLEMGDFERGWAEYEWRLKCEEFAIPPFRQPMWAGEPLDGRTILLYADHGLGDSIQFIRYAPMVRARGGRVIVACQKPLVRILATCRGIDQVITEGAPLPDHDVYAPLMSLPRIFGTRLATIPADVPYLTAEPALVERWRDELGPAGPLRIGIAWQGNPRNRRDRQRSFRLARFEPLAAVAGVRLVSLQKGAGTEQIGELGDRFGVLDLGSRLDDLMASAAVMRNLDLVVTLDSALAHLAGALAVPTWVAIPVAHDWRWLTDREDNPWYPTLRLFRQTKLGDWNTVFQRMADELAAKMHD